MIEVRYYIKKRGLLASHFWKLKVQATFMFNSGERLMVDGMM
jgi:hypothetical protein